jgi:hypothetical protein
MLPADSGDRVEIRSKSPGSDDHLVRKRSPVRIRAWAPSDLEFNRGDRSDNR